MATELWLFVTAGGAALLGLAIAIGVLKERRLTRRERQKQKDATDKLYDRE